MRSIAFLSALALVAAAPPAPSRWTGKWHLDAARSSPGVADAAADAYRFTVGEDGALRWEIPSLGEVVDGRLDGRPMPIVRHAKETGTTLSVRAVGPSEWTYTVARGGKPVGGGRMVLVEDGTAWVDLSYGPQGPGRGVELVYRRTPT